MSSENFLVAEAQLALDAARKEKRERLRTVGEPIELQGKALAIAIKGNIAWIAENTTVIRQLDLETGKTLQVYKGHTAPVTALAFCDKVPGSGGQEILISGSWDKSIKLWDTSTRQALSTTPNAHSDFVKSLLVFPSLGLLVTGSSDKVVRFWDVSQPMSKMSMTSLGSISSHTRPVECLDGCVNPDGTAVLYTGDTMGIIKAWKLEKDNSEPARWTARLTDTFTHHRTRINELKYGNGLVWTASADETVQVIPEKVPEGTDAPKQPKPITHPVAVRAILPLQLTDLAEPYLITAAGDVLKTYDLSTFDEPELLGEMDAHAHDITAIRLWVREQSNDAGQRYSEPWIVTTSLDRTIRRWKLSELLKPAPPPPVQQRKVVVAPSQLAASELTEEEERELAELMDE